MSVDYTNYREWTEEMDWRNQYYFQSHNEYTPEEIWTICQDLISKAEANGLENCYLYFESTMEPYEDWLGEPTITAVGYRKLNTQERKELEREDQVRKLANEKGISPFEARNLLDLIEKGVVKNEC